MTSVVDERVIDEVEALVAILMDDVIIRRVGNVPTAIETVVNPLTGEDIDQQYVCVTLLVQLTPNYPDTSPDIVLRNPRGLDDDLIASIHSQIKIKLADCLGQPVVFELIDLIRENLTECNLPSGQCVICLFGFEAGDVFIKTQCYHHFHSHCLANHLISGKKYYKEEMDKLPNWQQVEALPYQPCCPVCRCVLSFDADTLKKAPPPVGSINAPPFRATPQMLALQRKMSLLLARQIRRGGVVGSSSPGPRPLTITTAADAVTNNGSSRASQEAKSEVANGQLPGNAANAGSEPGSPQGQGYRGPYRGFNRRGKPGRRGRGVVGPR